MEEELTADEVACRDVVEEPPGCIPGIRSYLTKAVEVFLIIQVTS